MISKSKLFLFAVIWNLFTMSLVIWWWIFVLSHIDPEDLSGRRMILWEGGTLVAVVLIGGLALLYFTREHQRQHDRLKLFFSLFAHDLRTSISRLRLQTEILQEKKRVPSGETLDLGLLIENVQLIDHQLENSLWMASLDDNGLMIEKFSLVELIGSIRNEFPELTIDISRDAEILADRRALRVALANLFHNSRLHARATEVRLHLKCDKPGLIEIQISDNGSGAKIDLKQLGQGIWGEGREKSNGIGLFLTKKLLQRMRGDLRFSNEKQFVNHVLLPGDLREISMSGAST